MIGWSFDGYLIYGRHLNTSNTGYYTSLDVCGGHTHGSYRYHYHAQVLKTTTGSGVAVPSGTQYYYYVAGVNQCWRENISGISFFGNSVRFQSRKDYPLLKPCTGSTAYWLKTGVSFPAAATAKTTTVPTSTPLALIPTGILLSHLLQRGLILTQVCVS